MIKMPSGNRMLFKRVDAQPQEQKMFGFGSRLRQAFGFGHQPVAVFKAVKLRPSTYKPEADVNYEANSIASSLRIWIGTTKWFLIWINWLSSRPRLTISGHISTQINVQNVSTYSWPVSSRLAVHLRCLYLDLSPTVNTSGSSTEPPELRATLYLWTWVLSI